jgi:glycosyltransferase involved in cell wall biosynthesis
VPRGQRVSDAFFLFPSLQRSPHITADIRVLNQITDFIREHQYAIVHTHSAKAGTVGRIAAHRAEVPIIVHTLHSLTWRSAQDCHSSSWQYRESAIRKWLYVQIERYVASLSDALIAVCELNRQEAINFNLAPPEKLTTIYSGIDLSRFKVDRPRAEICQSLGLDPNRPIIGIVARLATQKAPLDFVQAAQMTLDRKPHAQFVMVGDGPLALEVRTAIGDEKRIKMLGYRNDVPEILSILDLFVQSSIWEGLGRAVTEAMIMSVPVVATSVDGVPELVAHQRTGLLSPPYDPAQLAENILWMLDHPQEADRMGQRGKERVVPAFSAEKMVEEIAALYEHLLVNKSTLPHY